MLSGWYVAWRHDTFCSVLHVDRLHKSNMLSFFHPKDPSTYRLNSSHLRIKTVKPARLGPIKLCCCYQYSINNIDLSKVNDVDIIGEPAPCCQRTFCCAAGRDHVQIMTLSETDGEVSIVLPQGEGERISTMILHQIEEAQMIERD